MATLPAPVYGQPTAKLSSDQTDAVRQGQQMTYRENNKGNRLQTQDEDGAPVGVVWIYNVLELDHSVQQPPLFPNLVIPACQPGEKFAVTAIPAYVKEPYERPGDTEKYYKRVDGRKCATSLLNPDVHPSNPWPAQLIRKFTPGTSNNECSNANLNAFGVFWSMTPPSSPELEKELGLFRKYAEETLNKLVTVGDRLHAADNDEAITPRMHFAMDYFQRTSIWHTTHQHFILCPNCGDRIREGVIYHTTQQGDRCVLDPVRYAQVVVSRGGPAPAPAPVAPAQAAPVVEEEEKQLDDLSEEELLGMINKASDAMKVLESRTAPKEKNPPAPEAKKAGQRNRASSG